MSNLRESFKLIEAELPTANHIAKDLERVNFIVTPSTISNLTSRTLDGSGRIIGLFCGNISYSLRLEGADTLVKVDILRHDNFGDTASFKTINYLTIEKDGADPAISDNGLLEEKVVTAILNDAGTDGDFILEFDGYIMPVLPNGSLDASEDEIEFGEVDNGASDTLSVTVSFENLSDGLHINSDEDQFTVSLEEEGVFTETLDVSLEDLAGLDELEVFVRFAPDNVAEFAANLTIESEGQFTKVVSLTGEGIAP